MRKPVVLALVVQHHKSKSISVLALTQEYLFQVLPKVRGKDLTIKVIARTDASAPAKPLPVDSLTVIYGENGEGKTTLLLDLCRTLTRHSRDRPLGIIWRDEKTGAIRIDSGTQLGALTLHGPMTDKEPARFDVPFGPVFYTTSPFESARRRELAASGTIDGTPSFSTSSFNGTSLCQAVGSLPKDIPFIRSARVELRFPDAPTLEEEVERFAAFMFPEDVAANNSKRKSRTNVFLQRLRYLDTELTPHVRSLLAVELYRARLDGPKASEELLMQLVDRKEPLQGSQALGRFLSQHISRSKYRISTPHVVKAVQTFKKVATSDVLDKLQSYSDLLTAQSSMVLAGLQEAESLGLVQWRFLDLSSGQVALLMLFASLASALETLRSKGRRSAVLVIDEGEMFMHPAWQRKYLRDLMEFIQHFRENFDEVHLILATHSLIVAGDAPPNRLFDVKSGEMKNGFAYGPREVLDDVYGVKAFAGDMAESLYDEIVKFLKGATKPTPSRTTAVRSLIEQIASPQLRTYLLAELERMMVPANA